MRLLVALLLTGLAAFAQVQVKLSVAGDRSTFYIGEAIPLQLAFELQPRDDYIIQPTPERVMGSPPLDQITITPAEGAEDPLSSRPPRGPGGIGMAGSFGMGTPPKVVLHLNEWFSFRQPGKYTVHVLTRRVHRRADQTLGEPVPVETNPVEIEIVEPPKGWAAQTLADARAILESIQPGRYDYKGLQASRTVKYLRTPEAARAMAVLAARTNHGQLIEALWTSPHRALVIEEMEKLLTAPDVPIYNHWLMTLAELAASVELPPRPDETTMTPGRLGVYQARFTRYQASLLAALPRKTSEARTISAMTLFHLRAPIPAETLREILLATPDSTAINQYGLFADLWPVIASPEIGPFVERAAFPAPGARQDLMRTAAIRRLVEIDPATARRRILEEIRAVPEQSPLYQSFYLPDRELPELDEAFVELLKRPNAPWLLIARYGTRTILPAVLEALDRDQGPCVREPLFYLFRVDPEEARRRYAVLTEPRADGIECGLIGVPGNPRDFWSEALEDLFIANLESPDPQQRSYAAMVLGNSGSARAEEPLWRAMERWRASLGEAPAELTPRQRNEESTYHLALASPWGWLTQGDRLEGLCVSKSCKESAANWRKMQGKPVRLHYHYANLSIDRHPVSLPEGLRERLKVHPRGTRFVIALEHRNSWAVTRFERQLRAIFDEAGHELEIEDPPAPR